MLPPILSLCRIPTTGGIYDVLGKTKTKNIGCTHLLFSGEGGGEEAGPGKPYLLPGTQMIEGLKYSLLNTVRFEMMYFPYSDSELRLKRRALKFTQS